VQVYWDDLSDLEVIKNNYDLVFAIADSMTIITIEAIFRHNYDKNKY